MTIDTPSAAKVTLTPSVPGVAHVILQVENNATPSLTSYRRVIVYAK